MSLRLAVPAALVLVAAPLAHAQFAKPAGAIKYRQSAMFMMRILFFRIGAMVQGKVPWDAAQVAANAELVEDLSRLPWAAFGPGTDKGDTRAKPDVWQDNAKFVAGAKKLQEDSAKLAAAARTGDETAVRVLFDEVGKTCKGCHDNFRKD